MTTATKQRPILFSAPMVRALLDGTKTQTRRVVKLTCAAHIKEVGGHRRWHPADPDVVAASPYGKVGDQLWVRETWYCDDFRVQRGPYLKPDDFDVAESSENGCLVFRSDGSSPYEAEQPKWKPAIHMPRWASRITLEITGVRVERLHDISEADAAAEGWTRQPKRSDDPEVHRDAARDWYSDLWEQINGVGSWKLNPWVWVIEFQKVTA